MKYCTRCLYPENHPLHLTFDDRGVCSGCLVHEEKDELDWDQRLELLRALVKEYRSKSGRNFDCIVPVSGARDSYFIVHTVKNVLGLKPLLVSYNKHYNTYLGIRNLAYLRTHMDCDCLTMTVDPKRVKRITRLTLELMGSMYWHCLAGQTVFPVQTATRFKIPLIIWGAHQGVDQVGMFSHLDQVEMTRKYRKEHDLMGYEAEDLLAAGGDLRESDVTQFVYPHDKEIEAVGVRGIYLNNYFRWDTKAQHERMIKLYGYETAPQQRTFDSYNDVDSFHYSGLHDWLKLVKHGYSKVVDHACREIRLKRLTREDGIRLVSRYLHRPIRDLDLFLDWLEMSEEEFYGLAEKHRNLDVWERDGTGGWRLKDDPLDRLQDHGVEQVRLDIKESCDFIENSRRTTQQEKDRYTLIGKGWVHNYSRREGELDQLD